MQRRPHHLIILATLITVIAGTFVSAAPVARADGSAGAPCTITWDVLSPGAGESELMMSSVTFQVPSPYFFQTVMNLPLSTPPFIAIS